MSEQRMHWKRLLNPEFLGEYEFLPGEEKTATIKTLEDREITGPGGKKEIKPVMTFEEQIKPLIMNKTNLRMIEKLFKTPDYPNWYGKQIILYGDPTITFGNEVVGGVRIRKELPTALVCADCGQIIAASGKFTAKAIAQSTQNTYSRPLCMDCAKEAKAKQRAVHEDDNKKSEEFAQLAGQDIKEGEETNA